MRRYTCTVKNCGRVTYFLWDCDFCSIRYCEEHDTVVHHPCARKTSGELVNEKEKRTNKLMIAEDFPGYTVQVPPVDQLLASGTNIHFPVVDTDGVKWLARVAYTDVGEISNAVAISAAATMKFLEPANAMVPRVLLPPNFTDYYLIEFMQGSPADLSLDITQLDQEQRKTLFRDFAQHFIALASVHIKGIGSLRYESGKFEVGPVLEKYPPLAHPPYFLGPFTTILEEYMTRIEDVLKCLEQESVVTSDVIARYLVQLELRRVISTCPELRRVEEEHYVMHGESVGSQFMLKDGRLTAVLDWDWSRLTTKAEAFSGAALFWDTHKFFTKGCNELSEQEQLLVEAYVELGRDDLANCVRNGKKYQRLGMVVGGRAALPEVKGLQDAFGVEVDPQETLDEWCEMAAGRYEGNQGLMRLNERFK